MTESSPSSATHTSLERRGKSATNGNVRLIMAIAFSLFTRPGTLASTDTFVHQRAHAAPLADPAAITRACTPARFDTWPCCRTPPREPRRLATIAICPWARTRSRTRHTHAHRTPVSRRTGARSHLRRRPASTSRHHTCTRAYARGTSTDSTSHTPPRSRELAHSTFHGLHTGARQALAISLANAQRPAPPSLPLHQAPHAVTPPSHERPPEP